MIDLIQAIYNNTILAQSDKTYFLEGNHYFPAENVKTEFLEPNQFQTTCPWKGQAHYYDSLEPEKAKNIAWYYPEPKEAAKDIKGHIAFDTRLVEVKEIG